MRPAALVALAAAVLGGCATSTSLALPAPVPVERPSLAAGDRWQFVDARGGIVTLIYQGARDDALLFERVRTTQDAAPVRSEAALSAELALIRDRDVEYRPDDGALRFPLAVGRSWRHQYVRVVHRGGVPDREEEMVIEATVKAYERIDVPAGMLDAFRVESVIRDATGALRATYWYAPSVKTIVRYHARAATGLAMARPELKAFEAAR